MVKYSSRASRWNSFKDPKLDYIFHSFSDPTRRKILEALTLRSLTVLEIKKPFRISLPAISKHLKVLEKAGLIRRQKLGREYLIHLRPSSIKGLAKYIEQYKKYWSRHFDALEKFVEKNG